MPRQGLSTPPSPQPDLGEWLGCGRFVKRSGQPHVLVFSCFRLACDGLELLLHAGKLVVRASSAPILSAESAVHGTTASPWCSPFCPSCVSLSVVRVCLATWCGPVYFRSWRSPSSVHCRHMRSIASLLVHWDLTQQVSSIFPFLTSRMQV